MNGSVRGLVICDSQAKQWLGEELTTQEKWSLHLSFQCGQWPGEHRASGHAPVAERGELSKGQLVYTKFLFGPSVTGKDASLPDLGKWLLCQRGSSALSWLEVSHQRAQPVVTGL